MFIVKLLVFLVEIIMGRKSVKEDKSVYQLNREELGLSRAAASKVLSGISEDRLTRIEQQNLTPHPDEVLIMAEGYKAPELHNHYCANECPIGKKYAYAVEVHDLASIVLGAIASLNEIKKHEERLVQIAADNIIDDAELKDLNHIGEDLEKLAISVEAFRLWVEQESME